MLWFFNRGDEALRIETHYENDTREYVVVVHWPDGRQQIERFAKSGEFRSWLNAFEGSLERERWMANGHAILPSGWPDKPPIQ